MPVRDYVLSAIAVVLAVTLRQYAIVTSTASLIVSIYAMVAANRALNKAKAAVRVVIGDDPPKET